MCIITTNCSCDSCGGLERMNGGLEADTSEASKQYHIGGRNQDEAMITDDLSYVLHNDSLNPLIYIKGGLTVIGTDDHVGYPSDFEGPKRTVQVSSFYIQKYEVSNIEFEYFVNQTGYVTDSEHYQWSFVFDAFVPDSIKEKITEGVAGATWWLPVTNASWKYPEGTLFESSLPSSIPINGVFDTERASHPVVHLSWNDANAYCKWRYNPNVTKTNYIGRLPTEAEWEYAARGVEQMNTPADMIDPAHNNHHYDYKYPWGNKLFLNKTYRANYFQGTFPKRNNGADGYIGLSPVDAYPPQNSYGLHNMIGNAWEWVSDWWDPFPYGTALSAEEGIVEQGLEELNVDINALDTATSAANSIANERHTQIMKDPQGPKTGVDKVKKGGSFLCHHSYCNRYRTAARTQSTPDSAGINTGVRCVAARIE